MPPRKEFRSTFSCHGNKVNPTSRHQRTAISPIRGSPSDHEPILGSCTPTKVRSEDAGEFIRVPTQHPLILIGLSLKLLDATHNLNTLLRQSSRIPGPLRNPHRRTDIPQVLTQIVQLINRSLNIRLRINSSLKRRSRTRTLIQTPLSRLLSNSLTTRHTTNLTISLVMRVIPLRRPTNSHNQTTPTGNTKGR